MRWKKKSKKKIQKNRKKENPKIEKGKSKKSKREKKSKKFKKKRKKNLFSVVLDKICVFCLYPIPDSQQYVKRVAVDVQFCPGYCVFSVWVSGPFVTSFEFGPRTLSFPFSYVFYRVFESFYFSYLFRI